MLPVTSQLGLPVRYVAAALSPLCYPAAAYTSGTILPLGSFCKSAALSAGEMPPPTILSDQRAGRGQRDSGEDLCAKECRGLQPFWQVALPQFLNLALKEE